MNLRVLRDPHRPLAVPPSLVLHEGLTDADVRLWMLAALAAEGRPGVTAPHLEDPRNRWSVERLTDGGYLAKTLDGLWDVLDGTEAGV